MRMLTVEPFQETLQAGMCGPASLKMVLRYYGIDRSEAELAQLMGTDAHFGTGAKSLKTEAEKLGLKAEIKDGCTFSDIEKWLDDEVPVIVNWFTSGRNDYPEDISAPDGHYAVVCGLDDAHIYLQDPEIGRMRKMQRAVFEHVWFDFDGESIEPDTLVVRRIIAIHR